MQNSVTTIIDPDACIGCGECVAVCPAGTISMQGDKAVITGSYSMGCGHCEAVCPTGAIRVEGLEHPFALSCTPVHNRWLPHGEYDTGELVRLMRSRRSCRNYQKKEIDRQMLDDLVRIGTTAPSGTNAQLWTFTILAGRREVISLGEQMAGYFRGLNRMAEKSWLRFLAKFFAGDALGNYYRCYYETVRQGLLLWDRDSLDTLFHGAVAAILVGGKKSASTPMEDALLASQNILLAAHSLGLGSCMIGFAVEAIRRDKEIRRNLQIPEDELIYSVIALGYPAETYNRAAHRKRIVPRYPSLINKDAGNG
ncbi:MAG: nitroreductase family protein [Desulfobulbales bacterium]|nr:nitroreductase family protein [Desulfobulbales bacterium]